MDVPNIRPVLSCPGISLLRNAARNAVRCCSKRKESFLNCSVPQKDAVMKGKMIRKKQWWHKKLSLPKQMHNDVFCYFLNRKVVILNPDKNVKDILRDSGWQYSFYGWWNGSDDVDDITVIFSRYTSFVMFFGIFLAKWAGMCYNRQSWYNPCGRGGIGRHDSFRCCYFGVQVQVLSPAEI